ncbi:MAG: YihY/virulence factor BrkB family protein [Cyclobacteriaceae bacterium]|nr:YihY/virulence factor BrkB family protein [Cyclobacteriaceae bacterium]
MLDKIYKKIKPLVDGIIKTLKGIKLPGFEGLSLYIVIVFFVRALEKGSLTTRASAVAFNFFLAFIPAVIFIFSLIPYIPVDNFQEQLFSIIANLLPEDAFLLMKNTIEDTIAIPRGGLLSIGFFLALFFATNGMSSIIDAFNTSYLINHKYLCNLADKHKKKYCFSNRG